MQLAGVRALSSPRRAPGERRPQTAPSSPSSIRPAAQTLAGDLIYTVNPCPTWPAASSSCRPRPIRARRRGCSRSSTEAAARCRLRSKAAAAFGIAYRPMTDERPAVRRRALRLDPRRGGGRDRLAAGDAARLPRAAASGPAPPLSRRPIPDAEWLIVERDGAPVGRLYLDERGRRPAPDRHLAASRSSAAPASAARSSPISSPMPRARARPIGAPRREAQSGAPALRAARLRRGRGQRASTTGWSGARRQGSLEEQPPRSACRGGSWPIGTMKSSN